MRFQEPPPESPWLDDDEPDPPEPVSPFLDPRLHLGAHSLPIPELTDANPISLQVSAALPRELRPPIPATILQRGAAKMTDWFLTGILYTCLSWLWISRSPFEERSAAISLSLFFAIPGFWFTWFFYNIILNGRTLGKQLFGLQVMTDTAERLSPGRNFGRVWAESLSWALFCSGYLLALFDPAKRTLHDHLCGTRVILRSPR